MELKLIERNKRDSSTDLVCISNESQIYVPKVIVGSPAYLKKGSVIWVKRELYNIYELTEDITENNKDEFIAHLQSVEGFIAEKF